jgi:hypothetical protein
VVTKEDIHKLIDQIPEDTLPDVVRYLEEIRAESDPFLKYLESVPEEDEPVSEEEARAIDEAKAEVARGEVYSLEEIRREFLRGAE